LAAQREHGFTHWSAPDWMLSKRRYWSET
jgi:hypothetical protein